MNTGETLIVTLRVYRGKVTYDINGKCTSENQPMTLEHGTSEWNSVMNSGRYHFSKMTVEKVEEETESFTDTDKKDKSGEIIRLRKVHKKEIDISQEIKDQVDKALKAADVPLTEDQKKLIELQTQIDAISTKDRGKTHKVVVDTKPEAVPVDQPDDDSGDSDVDELKAARAELRELTGKVTYHKWDLASVKEKIESHK